MAETESIQALAEALGIERRLLYFWRDAYALSGEAGLRRAGRPSAAERAAAALRDAIQRLSLADRKWATGQSWRCRGGARSRRAG